MQLTSAFVKVINLIYLNNQQKKAYYVNFYHLILDGMVLLKFHCTCLPTSEDSDKSKY